MVFHERVFPGVLEEVVLLLAEGDGPTNTIEISSARNLAGLDDLETVRWKPRSPDDKWTAALIASDSISEYADAIRDGLFIDLEEWGQPTKLSAASSTRSSSANSPQPLKGLRTF